MRGPFICDTEAEKHDKNERAGALPELNVGKERNMKRVHANRDVSDTVSTVHNTHFPRQNPLPIRYTFSVLPISLIYR